LYVREFQYFMPAPFPVVNITKSRPASDASWLLEKGVRQEMLKF
jgi:hypothetical protein